MADQVVTITRTELVGCMRAGAEAFAAGLEPTACPFDPAGDADERLRVAAWMRAYVRAEHAAR